MWRAARKKLGVMQAQAAGTRPRTLRLALALQEPLTHRTLEARGAVALSPPSSLRMILLGPGGTTALDLWARGDAFRFAIPAIDLLRRGDASTPPAQKRGLPVDFLRWWLLRPASGRLVWYAEEPSGERFVLRDGAAIVDLHVDSKGKLNARRTTFAEGSGLMLEEETVEASKLGCGVVFYHQQTTHLSVTVTCEGEETEREPSARAFADPDGDNPMRGEQER